MEEFAQTSKKPAPKAESSRQKRTCGGCVVRVLILGLLLCAVCAIVVWGLFHRAWARQTSSPPYKMALQQLQTAPEATQALGEPIEVIFSTWLPNGHVFEEDASGEASWDFDVAGPKGKAHIHTESRMFDGQWSLTVLEMTPDGGQRVRIEIVGGEGLPDAPKWSPAAPDSGGGEPDGVPGAIEAPSLPEGLDVTLPPVDVTFPPVDSP